MKLMILEPDPPAARAWISDTKEGWTFRARCEPSNLVLSGEKPDAIAVVQLNGGRNHNESIAKLDRALLAKLDEAVPEMPEHNGISARLARSVLERFSDVPAFLLCDTALFASLPPESANYAVPLPYRLRGLSRRGRHGLDHLWALARAREAGPAKRVVTVVLGPVTTVTGFVESQPVDTTAGFTPIEGIVSLHGCGDIDPTIALHLRAAGMPVESINRQLAERAGLRALAGEAIAFEDLFDPEASDSISFARRVLETQIVKAIGAMTASAGGADTLVVAAGGPTPGSQRLFIRTILEPLADILSLDLLPDGEDESDLLTTRESATRVLFISRARRDRLAQLTTEALQGGLCHV